MAKKPKTPRKQPARRTAAKADAAQLPVHQTLTPSAPFELKASEIERALVTGEHSQLLERYFGAERYAEMQDLTRKATTRSVRGAPRVYILPGIMGSTLGSPRPFFLDDVIWIDPIDIARGELTSLALLPGAAKHQALSAILLAYLRLKLTLRIAGYDADFFAYDWRLSMDELGRRLSEQLAKDPAAKISLVAHSMGGLVSRAALTHGAGKLERLIMLGTPNHGSFNAVQALRGVYSVIRKIAQIDLRHSPEELTEKVFNTFPGLYQLLPDPAKFSAVDLYSVPSWPATPPAPPRPALLKQAKGSQSFYAPPNERFFLIAGVNQETITDLKAEGGEFVYTTSNAGDGTVPLAFAELPGVKTFYVEEAHGGLPNNSTVGKAVSDLLGTGSTDALPQQWSQRRAATTRTLTEDQVRAAVSDVPRGAAVSDGEVRHLLEEVAAPDARDAATQLPAREKGYAHRFDRLVVGRQRQRRLDLRLALGSITEANNHAYVLGIFRDVTPTGAAQAVDERLDGAIAEFSRRRMFSGNVGEIFVLPTGCHPLRPETVLLAGLGSFDRFNDEVLQLVAENAIRTLVHTGVEDFATVLIGGGSGADTGSMLKNLLTGFIRGLKDSDTAHDFRRVTLCEMNPEQYARIKEELYRLASTELFADVEVTFEEIELPAPMSVAPAARGLRSSEEAPVYLLVRQEGSKGGAAEFVSSGPDGWQQGRGSHQSHNRPQWRARRRAGEIGAQGPRLRCGRGSRPRPGPPHARR